MHAYSYSNHPLVRIIYYMYRMRTVNNKFSKLLSIFLEKLNSQVQRFHTKQMEFMVILALEEKNICLIYSSTFKECTTLADRG